MLGDAKRMTAVSLLAAAGVILSSCSTPTAEPTVVPEVPTAAAVVESTATPEPAPAPGPTAVPDIGVPVIAAPVAGGPTAVANYNTYIYGGPSEDYVVYGAFLGSQPAEVIGRNESGTWWAISVPPAPGGTGWVDGAWVTVTGADGVPTLPTPPVPPTTELVPPAAGDPQATALVNTYVLSGPGSTFPAYGIAPEAATARVIGKSSDGTYWVVRLDPATVGAGYGWVGASTVQASNADAVPVIVSPATPAAVPPTQPPAGAATATAIDYVYVRSGAGTCFSAYGTAAPGATAEIAGKSSDGQWWQVKIPTTFVASGLAWVSGAYVTTANTASVPTVETGPCSEVPPPPQAATYACFLAAQDPEDYAEMEPGSAFTMVWTMDNTGTSEWTDAELRYVQSGSLGGFHSGPDSIDIGAIAAGASYSSSIPALTPSDGGTFGEVWEVVSGGESVCGVYMIITVVE
jgi:uncharacterized protein YgiM (DUF1202 family)